MSKVVTTITKTLSDKLSHLSSEGVGWLAVVFIHCATVPSILSLIFAVSDRLPSLDIVLFLWTGLILFFIKALIQKDMLNIITIGGGFFIQALLLAMVVFK
jgi:hypothetical protein